MLICLALVRLASHLDSSTDLRRVYYSIHTIYTLYIYIHGLLSDDGDYYDSDDVLVVVMLNDSDNQTTTLRINKIKW